MEQQPLVSVIIITLNEEKNIKQCLDSVFLSDYLNKEVVVVDGGSTDRTLDIVSSYQEVKILISPKTGMTRQRNFGFFNSQSEYILSLDADMRINSTLISSCVHGIIGNDFVGLYIPEIVSGDNFFNKVRRFERSFYNGTVIDAVRFFKKKSAQQIGFYDEDIGNACEDWDFDKRLRALGEVKLVGDFLCHDESEVSFFLYLKKKIKYIGTMDEYVNKWGKDDVDIKKQFGLKYRFFSVFIENGKWKKILIHPILFCCVFFLKFLVGSVYLIVKRYD